jgi:hypothetical protein
MTTIKAIILIAFVILLSGCYPGISGKVVDGLTGNPLEGAVVLAQWTTTGGLPGLTHHTVYQIEESETDKEGKFSISGVYNPFVDPPKMVIYRKGYVPWRNDRDFKDKLWSLYDKIIWQNNLTYRLEHWNNEYSKEALSLFLNVMGTDFNNTPKYSKIESEAFREGQAEVDARRKGKKP